MFCGQGNELFDGIDTFFKELEAKTYKIQNRVMLARYRGKTKCSTCGGSRLRKESLACLYSRQDHCRSNSHSH